MQQPVLQVCSVDEVRLAELARPHHRPRLLDERIATVIERDGVDDPGFTRGVPQRPGIFGIERKRLVRDDVLAMCESRHDDRNMQMVRRRVVDNVNVGVRRERFITAVRLRNPQRIGLFSRRRFCTRRHRHDIHKAQAADGVDVMRTDKPWADQSHPETTHMFVTRD